MATKIFVRTPDGVSVRTAEDTDEILDLVAYARDCGTIIDTPTLIMFEPDRETTIIIQFVKDEL